MTRTVYRVALASDVSAGPYTFDGQEYADDLIPMYESHGEDEDGHTTPWNDLKLMGIRKWESCGLDSLEALTAWFDGYLSILGQRGFVIYVYEASLSRVGANGQVVFQRCTTELTGTIPLTLSN